MSLERLCTVADCDRPLLCKGMCSLHYNRARYRGETGKRVPARHGTVHMYQGLGCRCDDCRNAINAYRRDFKRRNPEKTALKARRDRIRKVYGIELDQYDAMFAAQGGLCAICRQPPKTGWALCIDHDHVTGQVRGLLCLLCNSAIGKLGDDPQLLIAALDYLLIYTEAEGVA